MASVDPTMKAPDVLIVPVQRITANELDKQLSGQSAPSAPTNSCPTNMHGGFVSSMPISVQRGFRVKALGLLTLQLWATILIMWLYAFSPVRLDKYWTIPVITRSVVDDQYVTRSDTLCVYQGLAIILAFFGWILSIFALHQYAEIYPKNYALLVLATLCYSFTLGAGNPYFENYANFQLVGYPAVAMTLTTLMSTRTAEKEEGEGRELVCVRTAGSRAYALTAVLGLVLVPIYEHSNVKTAVGSLFWGMLLHLWFCFDAKKLMEKMNPDEYMRAVVHFYADLLHCCAAGVVCAAGGAGA